MTNDARNVLRASYSRLVGFRRQFAGQISTDLSATRRIYHDQFEQVDINGRYPAGPFQPFGGFGLVDPNQGIIYKETNGNWTRVVVSNIEGTIAQNMSHNLQMVLSLSRQWQHLEGTWNPTDPARFIQPNAFPNDGDLSTQLFGNGDHNTLDGRGRESGAAYAIFGPPSVTLANGATQSNPLATSIRFCGAAALPCATNPRRGDGQTINDTARYLQPFNRHPPRAYQLSFVYKF